MFPFYNISLFQLGKKKRYGEINGKDKGAVLRHSVLSLCDPVDYSPPGSSVHGDAPGKNAGVGSLSLIQGIFPQGVNRGLLHCRHILYQLSYQGSHVGLRDPRY